MEVEVIIDFIRIKKQFSINISCRKYFEIIYRVFVIDKAINYILLLIHLKMFMIIHIINSRKHYSKTVWYFTTTKKLLKCNTSI